MNNAFPYDPEAQITVTGLIWRYNSNSNKFLSNLLPGHVPTFLTPSLIAPIRNEWGLLQDALTSDFHSYKQGIIDHEEGGQEKFAEICSTLGVNQDTGAISITFTRIERSPSTTTPEES